MPRGRRHRDPKQSSLLGFIRKEGSEPKAVRGVEGAPAEPPPRAPPAAEVARLWPGVTRAAPPAPRGHERGGPEPAEVAGDVRPRKCRVVLDPESAPPSYLLQVYYDGDKGRAAIILYDDSDDTVYVLHDNTGHKPYFLTDLPPDKVASIPGIAGSEAFDHIEVVSKYDLMNFRERKMTKVVVKDPQSVRRMRGLVPKAWEADIKYHDNYVYDNQLVPGLKYRIVNGILEPAYPKPSSDVLRMVTEAFGAEDEETRKMALEWVPMFESPPPRVRRVAVDIEVYTPVRGRMPDPRKASFPVISVAVVASDGFRKVLVLAREGVRYGEPGEDYPRDAVVELFDSERALLAEVFEILRSYPLVLTFNGDNFDLRYLYYRALKLGFPRDEIPLRLTQNYVTVRNGVHIDLYQFFENRAIQTYAFGAKYKEFTLDAISQALLGERKVELLTHVGELDICQLVSYNMRDAYLTLKLTSFDNELVWKLITLLMRISRMSIEDVTRKTVSTWIKSLLYWEHRRRGYLIPTRDDIRAAKGAARSEAAIKGKKYAGAVVLDPPQGVFFNVVVLDFASLYPSIIKNWNLSYETVNPPACPGDSYLEVPEVGHRVCTSVRGITAQITGMLRDFRVKVYKRRAKDPSLPPEDRSWYDVVQAAMKVFINASYGVFGSDAFPFYAPPVAESVTAVGRYVIRRTIELAKGLGLNVLYGDTDSLFLWSPDRKALEELIRRVEGEFGLELEVDKVYRLVAFSGLKKNYLGVYQDGGVDVKGMTGKKRNTPELLKKVFQELIDSFASIENVEDLLKLKEMVRDKIQEVYTKLKRRELTLDEVAFRVMLSKPLSEYVKTTPPHVKAALQLKMVGLDVQPGDIVVYVKTKGREGVKPVQLAKLSDLDMEKYLEHVRTTFEQLLQSLGVNWEEVAGVAKLEAFFGFR